MKWPISGIRATTKTIMPIAIGDGIPNIDARRTTKTPAIAAIRI